MNKGNVFKMETKCERLWREHTDIVLSCFQSDFFEVFSEEKNVMTFFNVLKIMNIQTRFPVSQEDLNLQIVSIYSHYIEKKEFDECFFDCLENNISNYVVYLNSISKNFKNFEGVIYNKIMMDYSLVLRGDLNVLNYYKNIAIRMKNKRKIKEPFRERNFIIDQYSEDIEDYIINIIEFIKEKDFSFEEIKKLQNIKDILKMLFITEISLESFDIYEKGDIKRIEECQKELNILLNDKDISINNYNRTSFFNACIAYGVTLAKTFEYVQPNKEFEKAKSEILLKSLNDKEIVYSAFQEANNLFERTKKEKKIR